MKHIKCPNCPDVLLEITPTGCACTECGWCVLVDPDPRICELEAELLAQAEIIGKDIDGCDKLIMEKRALELYLEKASGLLEWISRDVMPFVRMVVDGGEWHGSGHWMIDHICHDGPPGDLEDIESELRDFLAKRQGGGMMEFYQDGEPRPIGTCGNCEHIRYADDLFADDCEECHDFAVDRIRELEAELKETQEFLQAVICSEGIEVDVKGQADLARENNTLRSQLAAVKEWNESPFDTESEVRWSKLDKILSDSFACPECEKIAGELYDSIEQVYLRDKELAAKSRRLEMARDLSITLFRQKAWGHSVWMDSPEMYELADELDNLLYNAAGPLALTADSFACPGCEERRESIEELMEIVGEKDRRLEMAREVWEIVKQCGLEPVGCEMPRTAKAMLKLDAALAADAPEKWPSVTSFARLMRSRLDANEAKGGWNNLDESYLLDRLREEVVELSSAVWCKSYHPENVRHEAADVANFAMMIADNAADAPEKEKG